MPGMPKPQAKTGPEHGPGDEYLIACKLRNYAKHQQTLQMTPHMYTSLHHFKSLPKNDPHAGIGSNTVHPSEPPGPLSDPNPARKTDV